MLIDIVRMNQEIEGRGTMPDKKLYCHYCGHEWEPLAVLAETGMFYMTGFEFNYSEFPCPSCGLDDCQHEPLIECQCDCCGDVYYEWDSTYDGILCDECRYIPG